jgi:hypothetical protein
MKNTKVTAMTETEIQSATAVLVKLRRQMKFALTPTPAERRGTRKLTQRAVQATQMRAVIAREHRDGLPPSFDLAGFEHEVALLTALQACLTAAAEVHQELRNTFLVVGAGALEASKVAFAHLQITAAANGDISQALRHVKLRARTAKKEEAAAAAATNYAAPAPAPPVVPGASSAAAGSPQLIIVPPPPPNEDGADSKSTNTKVV